MNKLSFLQENAPCYLYNRNRIIQQCQELQSAIPQAMFLYSIKTNPFALVVETIAAQGFGADAASANEVLRAARAGIAAEQIYYSAPGKTEQDIAKTIQKCILIADSVSELNRINQYCARQNISINVGVRVNPRFSMGSMDAASSKFGIDEELLEESCLIFEHLKITGIHVHLRSQVLDTEMLCDYYKRCFALAERMNRIPGVDISFINFGSGIGTVYDVETETPLALEKINQTLLKLHQSSEFGMHTKFILETGRFIVCQAGSYYTRIVDRKKSRGKTYLIVQNGLNGFLRPAIAELLRQNLGEFPTNGQEPLYTSGTQTKFHILGRDGQEETVDIVGNLCTSLDVMAKNITLPHAESGDILEVTNAGSYAFTLTPQLFGGQDAPKEYLWID